ncbi:Uncharacterised protein [Streptococcus porcinus]|nr:Uncharacterised protein [Streptococcus porcinus]
MRPNHYPYSGKKNQSTKEQIASIENDINVLRAIIQTTRADLDYRISKLCPDSKTEYPAFFNSESNSSFGIS